MTPYGTYNLAHNEHGACDGQQDEPVCHAERYGAEDLTAEFYGKHLANEDDAHDEQEGLVGKEPREETVVCAVNAGVKQVPELQEDECREEHGKRVNVSRVACIGHELHVCDDGRNEGKTEPDNPLAHAGGDDKGQLVAGSFVHDVIAGGLCGQGEGRKGIHDEVDPQHLCNSEGEVAADEGTEGRNTACRHVDRKLEDDELLDVTVEGAPPLDGACDAGERVIKQDDV